jgi:hypothetical protein
MLALLVSASGPVRAALRGAALLLIIWGLPTGGAQAQTWMVSTTAQVKLGILDKYGSLGQYTATFVVREEKTGKEYFLTKEVPKGESGIDVLFPTEPTESNYFKTASGGGALATAGLYTWECRVNGKRAVGGRFTFPEVANDITVVNKYARRGPAPGLFVDYRYVELRAPGRFKSRRVFQHRRKARQKPLKLFR